MSLTCMHVLMISGGQIPRFSSGMSIFKKTKNTSFLLTKRLRGSTIIMVNSVYETIDNKVLYAWLMSTDST